MANDTGYSKSAFANQLGISPDELKSKARSAGFDTTEAYYNSGQWQGGNSNNIDMGKIPSNLDFAQGLEGGINDALSQLVMGYRAIRNPLDVYTELENAQGLPQQRKVAQTLREQISSLEDSIKQVRPTIAATTKQSMVTEGQRSLMETKQKQPFLERLGELSTNLGRIDESIAAGMSDLANKVNLYMQGQQISLEPLKLQYTSMVDRAARLTSAFGVDSQNQLDAYLMQIKRGWELDDQAAERAFELIKSENTYKQDLQTTGASLGITFTGNESIDEILQKIGNAAAEQIAYDRAKKNTTYDPNNAKKYLPDRNNDGQPDLFTPIPPSMSANPGSIYTDPAGWIWEMGADGKWK